MTLAVAIIATLAGWAWFDLAGRVMVGSLTVWVAMFAATLATASLFAFRSRDMRCILAAGVLVANFGAWHFAWQTDDPLLVGALADVVTAGWFVLFGVTRWELLIGSLYIASLAIGAITQIGGIPMPAERPLQFLAWSHPDLTSLLGHLASIVLGLGAGDAGQGYRSRLRVQPLVVAHRRRFSAYLGLSRQVAAD